jgi:hypothetical protein
MKLAQFCRVMTCLALWSLPAAAADLSKIDRGVAREPAYQTKTPKYALLVFGPEARHRVWLVLDGDALYVDRNGNGDLTEKGERFTAPDFKESKHPAHDRERSIEVGKITIGGLSHTDLTVSQIAYRRKVDVSKGVGGSTAGEWQEYLDSIWRQVPDGIVYTVSIRLDPKCYGDQFGEAKDKRILHFAWIDRHGQLAFAARAKDAPIIHFGGPLTLRHTPSAKLCRGNDEQVTLCLGTAGLGAGAFATMEYDLVPKDVHPTVEVQFPAKKRGESPITRKYVLKQRC